MELRDYQEDCIEHHWAYFSSKAGSPLFVVPTAGGKSHIIAEFLRRSIQAWPSTRAIVLTHVKELIQQNHSKFVAHCGTSMHAGIYSAGLKSRDTRESVIFAGIQSVYLRAKELGHFDIALIDECHLVPKKGLGRYRKFLVDLTAINPQIRIIGYTATPYRLDSGYLHEGVDAIFSDIAYDVTIDRLVREGWLSQLSAKEPNAGLISTAGVATEAGDYKLNELELAALASDIESAVSEMCRLGAERKSWLVFAVGIKHAERIAEAIRARNIECATIFGHTPKPERATIVDDFRSNRLRCLVNVGVLTTGFDAPCVDLLALMRPTKSTGLYVQIMGRGMRLSPETGKTNCLILDYSGNIERHGPVNRVRVKKPGERDGDAPVKKCPKCLELVPTAVLVCPACGYEFEGRKATMDHAATTLKPLDLEWDKPVTYDVHSVWYSRHTKKDKPDSMRVDYMCGLKQVSEWVCIEHGGFAGAKADKWWRMRDEFSSPQGRAGSVPATVTLALEKASTLATPAQILVGKDAKNPKYDRIVAYVWVHGDPLASARDPRVERLGTVSKGGTLTRVDGTSSEEEECPF